MIYRISSMASAIPELARKLLGLMIAAGVGVMLGWLTAVGHK